MPSEHHTKRRNIFNTLSANVPGARESVILMAAVLSVFLVVILASAVLFVNVVEVGRYGEYILSKRAPFLIFIWVAAWAGLTAYATRAMMGIIYRMTGPVHRLEHTIDEIIAGKEISVSVREGDVLSGMCIRLNKLLAMAGSGDLTEQRRKYKGYVQATQAAVSGRTEGETSS